MEQELLLLSWNVNFRSLPKRLKGVAEAIGSVEPDIVTLQEVPYNHASALESALASLGLLHVRHSHDPSQRGLPYYSLIASRWPLAPAPGGDTWRAEAPFPEVLGRVIVEVPAWPVDVFTAHIPNGSSHGWKKVDTFDTLVAALRGADDAPRILTGDFNEPKEFRSSGQMLTFGCGRKAYERWTNSVRAVLGGPAHHGLRDAYRDRHGFSTPTPVTHRLVGHRMPRCFDHTLVSRHFDVVGCAYYHEWRRAKLSDHSAMWTKLRFQQRLLPLVDWEARATEGEIEV